MQALLAASPGLTRSGGLLLGGEDPCTAHKAGGGGWWDERGFQPLPEDHPELKQSRPTLGSTPA